MSKLKTNELATGGCLGGFCLLWVAVGLIVCLWTDRNLDFWFTYFKGEEVDVPFFLSFITSVVGGQFVLAANVIGESARLLMF